MRDPQEDRAVRADAAGTLCGLGIAAYPYYDELLKLVMTAKPQDPLGKIDERLGARLNVLCKDPYATGLVKNKALSYAVVHKLLDHKRASGRIAGANLIANIPLKGFHEIADKIQKQWDAMVKQIEADTSPREMISFEDAKHGGFPRF